MSELNRSNPDSTGDSHGAHPNTGDSQEPQLSFEDLIVDQSLVAVSVIVAPAGNVPRPDLFKDEVLTALQCEV